MHHMGSCTQRMDYKVATVPVGSRDILHLSECLFKRAVGPGDWHCGETEAQRSGVFPWLLESLEDQAGYPGELSLVIKYSLSKATWRRTRFFQLMSSGPNVSLGEVRLGI